MKHLNKDSISLCHKLTPTLDWRLILMHTMYFWTNFRFFFHSDLPQNIWKIWSWTPFFSSLTKLFYLCLLLWAKLLSHQTFQIESGHSLLVSAMRKFVSALTKYAMDGWSQNSLVEKHSKIWPNFGQICKPDGNLPVCIMFLSCPLPYDSTNCKHHSLMTFG